MSEQFPELTPEQWAAYVQESGIHAAGAYIFDRDYYASLGRYPEESPLFGTTPHAPLGDDPRRQAIQNLVERGSTEGERAAARAALERLDESLRVAQDLQEEDDYLDAVAHGAA